MESFVNSTTQSPSNLEVSTTNIVSTVPSYHGFTSENIISAVFSSLLACVIIIGNGMVILAFKVNYKLRTVTNMCFVSLAVCDFLVGLVSIPLWVYYTFYEINNFNLYLFYISFDIFNGTASIFQLTAISLERCFSIVAPVRHRSMPVCFYFFMVFVVWFLAIASSLLRLLPHHQITGGDWYNFYTIFVCFALPVLIMITSYALLFRTAMKRRRLSVRSTRNQQISWSSQRKTIVTLIIVTGLFVIAWAPFFTYIALDRYFPHKLPSSIRGRNQLWRFVKWMHYSNSCLNPFVYSFRNREFKYTFKMLIHALVKCKRFEEVNRQFKRPTRFGIRRHTRDNNALSQTLCGGHVTRTSSLNQEERVPQYQEERGPQYQEEEGPRHTENITLEVIEPRKIQVNIHDFNSNLQ